MRTLIRYLLIPALMLLFSCDKLKLPVSCGDCIEEEPDKVNLIITFDTYQGNMYQPPEINVYEGNIEDSLLLVRTSSEYSHKDIPVTKNKKYTVTATYYYYGRIIIAHDSATPRVRFSSNDCDKPCYFAVDNRVDLRLKYSR